MGFELIHEDRKWLVRWWGSKDSYIDHPLAAVCFEDARLERDRFVRMVRKWANNPAGSNYIGSTVLYCNSAKMYV